MNHPLTRIAAPLRAGNLIRKPLYCALALALTLAAGAPAALAESVMACSYDGSPVRVDAGKMAMGVNADGGQVVAEIMKFTGLPQNFDVVEHPDVPNAAAVILKGPDDLPRRVIAYNPAFMSEVRSATRDNNWAPISIMAHEIGHHLSGHTIMPGGSQPPTELEADKFSGFVLYKMGAVLADAQKAMNTLVPEADGPTHPGRGKRVRAIEEGWKQACMQQSSDCSGISAANLSKPDESVAQRAPEQPAETAGNASPQPPARDPFTENGDTAPATASQPVRTEPAVTTAPERVATAVDVLPAPDANAIPAKFGKFVVDEFGLLDPATRAAFETRMFEHARQHGVEVVTLMVKNLHGLDADSYAYAMMRQLRVGKLDVGNGAVLVIAPNEKQVGVAFGAGVRLELRDYIDLEKQRLSGFMDYVNYCKGRGSCSPNQTELALGAAEHVADDTDSWDWNIRYASLPDMLKVFEETSNARMNGAEIEPEQDPTWRKIVRIEATLVSRDAMTGEHAKMVNEFHVESVGPAMHFRSADGRNLLVYADPHTEGQMPAKLEAGKRYALVAREQMLSQNPEDTLGFDLLSFDEMN